MSVFKNPNYKGSYEYLAARKRQYLVWAVICALLVAGFILLGILIRY